MNNILITSRSEDGTFTSNARNAIQEDFWWYWANTILILMNEKYNTNGIKTGSSKNINLLKVKRRHSWMQWSNKIQQHSCRCPVNHCYKCAKRKLLQANSDIKKLYFEVVCSKILARSLHMNPPWFMCSDLIIPHNVLAQKFKNWYLCLRHSLFPGISLILQ